MKCLPLSVMLFFAAYAQAGNLGIYGQTFPIAEKNMLNLIEERLQLFNENGMLKNLENSQVLTVAKRVQRPLPVALPTALKTRVHYYTPVVHVAENIADGKGNIIVAKGMSANALATLPSWNPVWLFFNADDEPSLALAKELAEKTTHIKLILTGGDMKMAEEYFELPVYFDQGGLITQKLKIKNLPALVTREKLSLKITEIALKGGHHAH